MNELATPSLDQLIDRILTWDAGVPVRSMERVIAMGPSVIPTLARAIDGWQDDEERTPVWLIVVLGELRHEAAVVPLVRQMRRTDFDLLAPACAEALAKIGAPVVGRPRWRLLSTSSAC
jgi:hypothetical protein